MTCEKVKDIILENTVYKEEVYKKGQEFLDEFKRYVCINFKGIGITKENVDEFIKKQIIEARRINKTLDKREANVRGVEPVAFNGSKVLTKTHMLTRNEIITLGLIFTIRPADLNSLLTTMGMQELYLRNIIEAIIYFTLETTKIEDFEEVYIYEALLKSIRILYNEYHNAVNNDILREYLIDISGDVTIEVLDSSIRNLEAKINNNNPDIDYREITGGLLGDTIDNAIDKRDFSLYIDSCSQHLCDFRVRSLYYLYSMLSKFLHTIISNQYKYGDLSRKIFENNSEDLNQCNIKFSRIFDSFICYYKISGNPEYKYLKKYFKKNKDKQHRFADLKIRKYCAEINQVSHYSYDSDRYVKTFIEDYREKLGIDGVNKSSYLLDQDDLNKIYEYANIDDNGIISTENENCEDVVDFLNKYVSLLKYGGLEFNISVVKEEITELKDYDDDVIKKALILFARDILKGQFKGTGKEEPYELRNNEIYRILHAEGEIIEKVTVHMKNGLNNIFRGNADLSRELFLMFFAYFNNYTNIDNINEQLNEQLYKSGFDELSDKSNFDIIIKTICGNNEKLIRKIFEEKDTSFYNRALDTFKSLTKNQIDMFILQEEN